MGQLGYSWKGGRGVAGPHLEQLLGPWLGCHILTGSCSRVGSREMCHSWRGPGAFCDNWETSGRGGRTHLSAPQAHGEHLDGVLGGRCQADVPQLERTMGDSGAGQGVQQDMGGWWGG